MSAKPLGLLQGTLDMIVLRALQLQPMHAYAVARWVHERTAGILAVDDAPLYKALDRLERNGFVSAEWGLSENNRRARYYALTAAGVKHARAEEHAWRAYVNAVSTLLEPMRTDAPSRS